jgi:hypothetical protein
VVIEGNEIQEKSGFSEILTVDHKETVTFRNSHKALIDMLMKTFPSAYFSQE